MAAMIQMATSQSSRALMKRRPPKVPFIRQPPLPSARQTLMKLAPSREILSLAACRFLYTSFFHGRYAMQMPGRLAPLLIGLLAAVGATPAGSSDSRPGGNLFIYNWSDYIAEDTIAQFEA